MGAATRVGRRRDPVYPRPAGSLTGAVRWSLEAVQGAGVRLPLKYPSQASAPCSLYLPPLEAAGLRGDLF